MRLILHFSDISLIDRKVQGQSGRDIFRSQRDVPQTAIKSRVIGTRMKKASPCAAIFPSFRN